MRFLIAPLLIALSMQAHAASTECFTLAKAAEFVAVQRDGDQSQPDAVANTNAYILLELDAKMPLPAVMEMVDVVYGAPDVNKQQVYSRVLEQCIALTLPIGE